MGLIRRGCSLFLVFFFYTWASCPIFSLASKFTIEKKKSMIWSKETSRNLASYAFKTSQVDKNGLLFWGRDKEGGNKFILGSASKFLTKVFLCLRIQKGSNKSSLDQP